MTTGTAAAYDRAAAGWLKGADPAYRRFAEAVVDAAGVVWDGALVVDVGAGSGATSRALRAVGARPVAVDAAAGMLRVARDEIRGLVCAAGDATGLPVRTASVDAVLVGFCLNHLTDPVRCLVEAGRVVRPGGAVVASTFPAGSEHPAKAAVDAVLLEWGWAAPTWYSVVSSVAAPLSDTPERLGALAVQAGLTRVRTVVLPVETGLRSPQQLVGWRLGMAQFAEFLRGLDDVDRDRIEAACVEAVGPDPQPLRRDVLMLSSVADAACSNVSR